MFLSLGNLLLAFFICCASPRISAEIGQARLQNSIDILADKLVDNLFQPALQVSLFHGAELDNTTLGFPGYFAAFTRTGFPHSRLYFDHDLEHFSDAGMTPTRPFKTTLRSYQNRKRRSKIAIKALPTARHASSKTGPARDLRYYTELAIRERGSPTGLHAMQSLRNLSETRLPFEFNIIESPMSGSVMTVQRNVLPSYEITVMFDKLRNMEIKNWLVKSDEFQAWRVDLIEQGKTPVPDMNEKYSIEFEQEIRVLRDIVRPFVYGGLLDRVQHLLNCPDVVVSDVYLRRYANDIATRERIAPEYGVSTLVTVTVPMEDIRTDGTNGLYTTAPSNHPALRRFFPLQKGDGLIHTWNFLQGVDLVPDSLRTSLVITFSTKSSLLALEDPHSVTPQTCLPWLVNRADLAVNDVAQYVLASNLEGISEEFLARNKTCALPLDAQELYVESALSGNALALVRVATLCEQEAMQPKPLVRAAEAMVDFDTPSDLLASLALKENNNFTNQRYTVQLSQRVARRFWVEAALQGNAVAQMILGATYGDESVANTTSLRDSEKLRVLSAVFFGLASQQGNLDAYESLLELVRIEIREKDINVFDSEEMHAKSRVVQVAEASIPSFLLKPGDMDTGPGIPNTL